MLRSERPSTTLVGCETLLIVVELTADQEEGENSDADTEADGYRADRQVQGRPVHCHCRFTTRLPR